VTKILERRMKDYHTYKNRTYQALGTQPAHDVVSTSNQSIITSSATLFYVLCRLGGDNTFDLFQRKVIIIIIILL